MAKPAPVVIEVVDRKTGEVVHRVETSESREEKVMRGMSINIDAARFKLRRAP